VAPSYDEVQSVLPRWHPGADSDEGVRDVQGERNQEVQAASMSDFRDQARRLPAVTKAALELGHEPRVTRVGSRFKLECSCGWSTPSNWSRKRAFDAVAQHVWEVGHLGLDDTPVVEIPQASSGRA
jgi:hypothetical protein